MYISYSGYDLLSSCLRAYYFQYILMPKLETPDNRVHMLYGDTVGKLFETFYEDALWQYQDVESRMQALVQPTLQRVITNERRKGGSFDWKEPTLKKGTRSIHEVEGGIRAAIPRGIRNVRHHSLLGLNAKAEVKLDVTVGEHILGGRADFIMTRVKPVRDRIIIDGKGSRWRDKYTNNRQLRWYALLSWLKFGIIPDRLGFLYWRFEPDGKDGSMDWSTVTQEALVELQDAALAVIAKVELSNYEILRGADPFKEFPASPGSDCSLCRYRELCPEGQRAVSKETKAVIREDLKRGVEDGGVSF